MNGWRYNTGEPSGMVIGLCNACLPAVAIVLVQLVVGSRAGQTQPVRRLTTGFEREVNRYHWTAGLRWTEEVGGWRVRLQNQFQSDAFLLSGQRIRFRDENRLRWQVRRSMGDRLSAHMRAQHRWFGQRRALRQELLGGLQYAPRSFIAVEPMVGVAWDRRPGARVEGEGAAPLRRDVGPAYGVRLQWTPPSLGGYDLAVEGDSRWHVINPRRGRTVHLEGTARRSFADVQMSARLEGVSLRRDTYQATSFLNRAAPNRRSETVEATTSDTLRAQLRVEAPLWEHLNWTSRLNVRARRRRSRTLNPPRDALFYNTAFDRRAYDAETALRYARDDRMARLALQVGAEADERRLTNREDLPLQRANEASNVLRQADYDEGYLTLAARVRTPLLKGVRLQFRGTANILRHDTPDVNPDDRDEAYYQGRLGLLWRLSQHLKTDVMVYGATYHTVYLNAVRSAENNRRRTLRLKPAVTWTPAEGTRLRLASEVRASYTRYDFVLSGRTAQDQAARELRYELTFEQQLGGELRLRADGRFSDLRLGRLLRDHFTEIPFDTLRTYSGHLRLTTNSNPVATLGLRFFIRSDYQRTATVAYPRSDEAEGRLRITRPARQWIVQLGPTTTLRWTLPTGHTLRLDGWLNMQRVFYDLYGRLPPADADRIRRAAREGRTALIPNLRLGVAWDF